MPRLEFLAAPRLSLPPGARRQPADFIPSRLRGTGIKPTAIRRILQAEGVKFKKRYSRIFLNDLTRDPCSVQHERRRVMFAAGSAGAKWGRGKGPFPASMRNKINHGCKR